MRCLFNLRAIIWVKVRLDTLPETALYTPPSLLLITNSKIATKSR